MKRGRIGEIRRGEAQLDNVAGDRRLGGELLLPVRLAIDVQPHDARFSIERNCHLMPFFVVDPSSTLDDAYPANVVGQATASYEECFAVRNPISARRRLGNDSTPLGCFDPRRDGEIFAHEIERR